MRTSSSAFLGEEENLKLCKAILDEAASPAESGRVGPQQVC